MSEPRDATASSAMLDAAFRLGVVRRLYSVDSRDEDSPEAALAPSSQRSRRALRRILAKAYRLAVPVARPVLARHRQYSTSIVLSEIAKLRLEVKNVGASVASLDHHDDRGSQSTQSARRGAPLRREEMESSRWFVDNQSMPNLHAALEHVDSRRDAILTTSGPPSQLAVAARDLSVWLERTSVNDSALFTLEVRVIRAKR